MSSPSPRERAQQAVRLLRDEGGGGLARRLLKRMLTRIPAPTYRELALDREDLLRVAEMMTTGSPLPVRLPSTPGAHLTVAWVCFAPGEGSGGHTTMFRMVAALEQAGHKCVVYLRDDHGWAIEQHRRTIRRCWPAVRAEIRGLKDGIEDADAIVATAWQTAYTVLASPAEGARLYFVQDFEPDFYPAGSEALLAEATYRFGFHGITAGSWLADKLCREYVMPADHFDFGCDFEQYRLGRSDVAAGDRTGVCYYCRPSTPRRAHELAVIALDLFAARHPEVDIHTFGEVAKGLPFRSTDHGVLLPNALNELYNRCIAGLVMSATNVSLVPYEMLASGCRPIVNEAEHNRVVLDNPEVVYAPATPFELADALSAVVEQPSIDRANSARRAALSVQARSWEEAGAIVERIIRDVVQYGSRMPTSAAV